MIFIILLINPYVGILLASVLAFPKIYYGFESTNYALMHYFLILIKIFRFGAYSKSSKMKHCPLNSAFFDIHFCRTLLTTLPQDMSPADINNTHHINKNQTMSALLYNSTCANHGLSKFQIDLSQILETTQ